MGNLILPPSVTDTLPFAVTAQLADLPDQAQKEFFDEYNRKSRSTIVGYLLHFALPGSHYAYLGKWWLMLLFWFTWGGLGVWWLIDWFRIPGLIKEHTGHIANDILKNVLIRHKLYAGKNTRQLNQAPVSRAQVVMPRKFAPKLGEFSEFSVESLKIGYGFDYELDNWEVVDKQQYDWNQGVTERKFKVIDGKGTSSSFLHLRQEGSQTVAIFSSKMNIHALDEALEQEILQDQRPRNILSFEGVDYYRENLREGLLFSLGQRQNSGQKVIAWEYNDNNHKKFLRIEQMGRNSFNVCIGHYVPMYEFTEIYPINR